MSVIVLAALGTGAMGLAPAPMSAQAVSQSETYRLAQVGGATLPIVVEEEDGCREEILEATITLEPNGEWTLVTREREVCGDAVEEDVENDNGRYEIDGEAIRFLDDDADYDDDDEEDLDLDDLADGTRTGDTLTVGLRDGQTMLVFRR